MKTKLRDQFAIAAVPGLIQAGYLTDEINPAPETSVETYRNFAKYAYKIADAMMLGRSAEDAATDSQGVTSPRPALASSATKCQIRSNV